MNRLVKIPGLWLLDSSGAVRIDHDDIIYCHHNNKVTHIVYSSGRLTRSQVPLKKIEEKLCKKKFYRCHRNYLVNLDRPGNCLQGNDTLFLPRRGSIPVSRRRRHELIVMMERINSGRKVLT
jgi:two-component system, LytTR family, response regulator